MNGNALGFVSSGGGAATERSEGEPGEPKRSGVAAPAGVNSLRTSRPDPEVVAKPQRRTYTAEYKQRILQEAEAAAATREAVSELSCAGKACTPRCWPPGGVSGPTASSKR